MNSRCAPAKRPVHAVYGNAKHRGTRRDGVTGLVDGERASMASRELGHMGVYVVIVMGTHGQSLSALQP